MAKFKAYSTEQGELIHTYLGDWIPDDHLARLVSDIVDQLDLSDVLRRYSHRGEEAYHPAMLLKLWFYGYATGIFTSRKIQTATYENVPFRWLCGGHHPDFRTVSDFRKQHLQAFPDLFKQIIEIAMTLGYVTLGHVSIDGTKIKANASKHKAMSRPRMKREMERLEADIRQAMNEAEQADTQDEESLSLVQKMAETTVQDRRTRLAKIQAALKELEERKPETESKTSEKDQINFTDSQSRIMDTKTQGVIQGYNPQIAVDEKNHLIVGFKMSNSSNDQKQFDGVLQSVKNNTGQNPEKTSADAGYFSAENIQAAKAHHTDAYMAANKEGKQNKNPYDKKNFQYDPGTDTYMCPAGKVLEVKQIQHENDPNKPTAWVYEYQACAECLFQKDCVKAKSVKRTLTRSEHDPVREEMRTKVQSDEGKAIYRKRKAIVEPAFGEMKEVQGFRQFHLRGEEKVSGEFVLLALSYILRKLHSAKYPKKATLYKRERSAQKRKNTA